MSGVIQAAVPCGERTFAEEFQTGFPPDHPDDLAIPRILRLGDAERIATDRLDGAAPGSLKEALAITVDTGGDGALRLTERLERLRTLTDSVAPLRSFQSAPAADLGWFAAVPPAHAFSEPEDWPGPWQTEHETLSAVQPALVLAAAVASTLREPLQVPLFDVDMSVLADAPDATGEGPRFTFSDVVGVSFFGAHVGNDAGPESGLGTGPDAWPVLAGTVPVPALAGPAMTDGPMGTHVAPLATAFVASARLAADAAAASQTLHSLKKLLTDTLLEEQAAQQPAALSIRSAPEDEPLFEAPTIGDLDPGTTEEALQDAGRRALPEDTEVRVPTQAPALPPPLPPAYRIGAVLAAAPGPARQAVQKQSGQQQPGAVAIRPAAAVVAATASDSKPAAPVAKRSNGAGAPRPARPRSAVRAARSEAMHTPLDIGGFCAGFALSGAIGVLLYFVMTAS